MFFDVLPNPPFTVYYYVFALTAFIPVARIFERAGFRPYWAVLLCVPDIGLGVCSVVLALRKWRKGT